MTTLSSPSSPRLVPTGSSGPLSEAIIPATSGKYYVYGAVFTPQKPLYALLDCKANKARSIAHAAVLGREAHLCFEFQSEMHTKVSAIKTAHAMGRLGKIEAEFDDVWLAPAGIAIEDFYTLSSQRDGERLKSVCEGAAGRWMMSMALARADVVAVMTSGGKYGLFLVKNISLTSISIEACHILLP